MIADAEGCGVVTMAAISEEGTSNRDGTRFSHPVFPGRGGEAYLSEDFHSSGPTRPSYSSRKIRKMWTATSR